MRRSSSRDAVQGLSEERRALARRYTVDAPDAASPEPARPAAQPEPPVPRRTSPLAGRLTRLRERFETTADGAEAPVPDHYDRLRNLGGENGRLRCARCGRDGSRGEDGWTLQLCGDDQLHTFCHDCYESEFDRAQ